MKKQLLMIFLTFSAISCFAKQPSNTELLTHLKNVKSEIQGNLQYLFHTEKELQQKLGQDYTILTNMWTELGNIDLLKKMFLEEKNRTFDLFCYEMKSLKDYSPMTHPLFSMTYDEKFLEKTMGPIFKKHLNKQNSQRIIHLMSTDNGEQIAFNFIIKNILIPLLQDIENKIQELEA